ncbi:MAG: MSHA biogenesis protein MshP [Vibrio sp.]
MKNAHLLKNKQTGNVLIVVIFVIVVMGLLASVMVRLQWSSQDIQSREILGTRAWFMAHSANEWGLTRLFPLGETGREDTVLNTHCTEINTNSSILVNDLFSSEPNYNSCAITLTCIPPTLGTSPEFSYFKLRAEATCGAQEYQVIRTQEVVVKSLK